MARKRKGSKKVHVVGGDLGHKMKGHKAKKGHKGGKKRTTRKK